jgi:hypothetical protein
MFETHKLTEQGSDEVREFKTTLRSDSVLSAKINTEECVACQ